MVARLHLMEGGGHTFSEQLYIRKGKGANGNAKAHRCLIMQSLDAFIFYKALKQHHSFAIHLRSYSYILRAPIKL